MKTKTLCLIAGIAAISAASAQELKPIFNGKDLSGWDAPADNIWFTVEDEVLRVKNGPKKKGKTLWTTKEYSDFALEFDFKMGAGTVDSGIFIRNEKEQIQIGISGSLKRDMTASPYIPGKGYPVEAEGVKELLKVDGWNTMRIEARGKDYATWLNGKKVMTYTSESAVPKGRLGIQLHGAREMTIEYRNMKAADLPKEGAAVNPEALRKEVEAMRVEDVAWRKIAWRTCLLDALSASRAENKPIVLWMFIDRPIDDKRC